MSLKKKVLKKLTKNKIIFLIIFLYKRVKFLLWIYMQNWVDIFYANVRLRNIKIVSKKMKLIMDEKTMAERNIYSNIIDIPLFYKMEIAKNCKYEIVKKIQYYYKYE